MRPLTLFSLATLLAAGPTGAADAPSGPAPDSQAPVIIGHRHIVDSEVLGEARTVLVRVPDGYAESEARYPVLYVLDAGESRFHDVTATVRNLADQDRIPQLVVVAVATPHRNRDLTPALSTPDSQAPASAGGADAFLSFLIEELFPFIDESFRTTHHRSVLGASFGGLFAFHALTRAPCAFDAYVAVSPSLWWDDRALLRRLEEAVRHPCAASDRLVLTVADEGELMTGPLAEAVELLETMAPESFAWWFLEVPDETHETTASQATYAGLRAVFADWESNPQTVTGAESLERLYERRADRYGVSAVVPAGSYFQLGWRLLGEGDVERARGLFLRALAIDPELALALAGLGMAQQRLGETHQALRNLRKAVELAERESHPMLSQIRDALAGVEARRREATNEHEGGTEDAEDGR